MLKFSLAAKILGVFIPLVLIAELTVFAFQASNFYEKLRGELLDRLENLVTVQSRALAPPVWEFDTLAIVNLVDQMAKLPFVDSVVVIDEHQQVLASRGDIDAVPEDPDLRRGADIIYSEQDQGQTVGRLRVTVNEDHIDDALSDFARFNALVLLSLFVALVGGTLLSTRVFIGRPLGRLKRAIEGEQQGRMHQRVDWQSSDELGLVVGAYNSMQDRQEAADLKIAEYQSHLEELVEARTAEIHSNIEYASRIQRAILPSQDAFRSAVSEGFIVWRPRDLVGGDMYWCRPWGDGHLIMLGDCTGHGVSGAFVTLIASAALERAEGEIAGDLPALVARMHQLLRRSLGQDGPDCEADDGMELGACFLPGGSDHLEFVGTRFDLFVAEGGEVQRFRGGKVGIGYPEVPDDQTYGGHRIPLTGPGQTFYLVTDGFMDQVGGTKRTMFGLRRLERLLAAAADLDVSEQEHHILREFERYQGDEVRRDDISVIGFRV